MDTDATISTNYADETPDSGSSRPPLYQRLRNNPLIWQGKVLPAFWTISGIMSFTLNVILIIVLIVLVRELFTLKAIVGDQLLGGLQTNFQKMDEAVIQTTVMVEDTIQVNDTIPVQFTLPLEENTVVVLTEDTALDGVPVKITIPGLTIDAPADIVLPAGSPLPVSLNLDVPVDQTIPISITVPVRLEVPVSIPLNQTELHEPFVGLQGVVAPYNALLADTPNSWEEAFCQSGTLLCWLVGDGNERKDN